MRAVERLKRGALETCKLRGHTMSKFTSSMRFDYRESWHSSCSKCGDWVQVKVHPLPNEIQVGGPAVAAACPPDSEIPDGSKWTDNLGKRS